MYIAFR
jgi:hypothetical protein